MIRQVSLTINKESLLWIVLPGVAVAAIISRAIATGRLNDAQALFLIISLIIIIAILARAKLLVLVVILVALPEIGVPGSFEVPFVLLLAPVAFVITAGHRGRWSAGGLGKVFALFLVAAAASILWSELIGVSAAEQLERAGSIVDPTNVHLSVYRGYWQIGAWILGFMVFLFALNQLRSLNDMRILTKAFIVVGLLVASYGYYEFASAKLGLPYAYPSLEGYDFKPHAAGVDLSFEGVSIPRIYSTFGEPKVLGNFLLVPIFLSLSHWTSKKKAIHLFMSAYLAGALILTFSTTAWLGLIVGSVVWVVLLGRGHLRQMLGLAGPIVVLAAASLIIVALLMPDSSLAPIRLMDYHLQRIIKIPTGSYMVADDYIIGWRSGWGLFTSSPILGVGIGNSPFYMLGIRTTFAGVIDHVFTPFNLFILILSETGVLGFAPFIALIAIPSLRAIRSIRTSTGSSVVAYERAILVGALAAFAGSMVTYAAFGGARFFIEEWLVLALLARGAQLVTSRSLASQQA